MSTTSDAAASTHADRIALPEVEMHIVRPTAPVIGRIVRSELCTTKKAAGFVRHVDIDISGTPLVGKFRPGQSFGVIPPGVDSCGKGHKVRLYSVASPTRGEHDEAGVGGAGGAAPGSIISTTVKRTIDEHWETHKLFMGVASNFLCDAQVGDEVMVSGPNGKRFLLPAAVQDHDYIFFATGTGIAPFRGMLIDLLESGCSSRVVLVMGSPYATDLLYHDFFLRMQAEHPNFHYLTAISRERQADGHDPLYVQDRLRTHQELLAPIMASPRALVYICGIAGMELGIFQQIALQFPEGTREHYLHVDPLATADVHGWTRHMIHKQVKPTRRVFMEVYA